jgi:hypothetical protein
MIEVNEESLQSFLNAACTAALLDIGETEVPCIQEELSIPVGRDAKGKVIQRSEPGEAPRMETGVLQSHIGFSVDQTADGPILNITSYRPVGEGNEVGHHDVWAAQELEDPAGLDRPYMRPALDRIEIYALDKFADAFNLT